MMLRHLLPLLLIGLATADDVLELVDTDFDGKLADIETALVMFYAPWCGHCKRLKPEFEKAASGLLANDPPVTLAKVDCTEGGKSTCGRFDVKGYPTLKIFRNGELSSDYNGPREAAGISKFMRSQVGPASKEVKTVAEAEAVLAKPEVVVFGFGDQPAHAKAAAKLRESVLFAHTTSEEVMTKLGHKDAIVLFRPKTLQNKFEAAEVIYEGADPVDKWVKANYHGICGVRTTDNAADFKNPLVTAYYAVDYVKNAKGTNYWRNRVMKVAADFSGLNFAVANKDDFQGELSDLGFEYVAGDKPPVVAAKDASGLKYRMPEVSDAKEFMPSLKEFLTQMQAGSLEPYLKSEAVPDNSANAVKVAVAKNFDELVMKSEKDVLVEFYAPWCGHCKKLTPIYDELGEKMADEDVEIVKMDATANDVPPQFDVKGFPTLYWLPKGSKKPTSYNGGREIDDFIKYIAEHASDELKGYDRKGKEKKVEL
jgi:protein disulfide isomerase family A protein 3